MPVDLASQLLSGPDLGGGFLFQLTWDRPPLPPGYTYHLQDAGSDAGERPAGSPELLGFAHPPTPCMYGGPGCWHLRVDLPESARSLVRVAYNRTRFVVGPMLAQALGAHEAPVREGMVELLDRIGPALAARDLPWQVGGSAGAWVRGAPIAPRDIDLGVDADGATVLASALEEYLIEPNHPVGLTGDARRHGAAFVGTLKAGIRVEWSSARSSVPGAVGPLEWEGDGWVARRERVRWEGREVPLAPVEFELVRLARRGDASRLRPLLAWYRTRGRPPHLLETLLRDPELSAEMRELLAGPGRGAASARVED